jgi:hypothetical protein
MNLLTLGSCKRRLATLWFGAFAILFLIVLVQSSFGHYGAQLEDAWGWFLPTLLPTLSLMVGVLVVDVKTGSSRGRSAEPFAFRLAFGVSMFYLIIVLATLLLQPFAAPAGEAVKYLKVSNLWLAPIQGLATAALGAFFIKTESSAESDSSNRETARG